MTTTDHYPGRKAHAGPAEAAVAAYLTARGLAYDATSPELHQPLEVTDAVAKAQRLAAAAGDHDLARQLAWVRYVPDYHLKDCPCPKCSRSARRGCYVEAKATAHMEQHAWEHYLDRDATGGEPVYLAAVLPHDPHTIRLAHVAAVVFKQAEWQPGVAAGRTTWRTVDWNRTPHQKVTVPDPATN